jgi:hypothetical protein
MTILGPTQRWLSALHADPSYAYWLLSRELVSQPPRRAWGLLDPASGSFRPTTPTPWLALLPTTVYWYNGRVLPKAYNLCGFCRPA